MIYNNMNLSLFLGLFLSLFLCFGGKLNAQQVERNSAKVEIVYQCDSITHSTIVTVIDNKIYVHDPDKSPLSLIPPEKIESVKITNNYKMIERYKKLKGLKKENLRDNMSTMEIVLNMLAEATTTELSKAHQPEGFSESQKIAHRGGSYAGQVRQDIEKDTGRPVITSQNAAQLNAVVVDMIESVAETETPDNDENK